MNILCWHVHAAWMTSFVSDPSHTYLIPVLDDRGPDGRGRARTYDWPSNAVEVRPDELAAQDIDLVVVQRERDLALSDVWLGGRRPGSDLPLVWLEHNAPQGLVNEMVHPSSRHPEVSLVVHVSHTNELLWDCGTTPTTVIEHGIPDPGLRYDPVVPRAAVVINEPVRRHRVAGTDLLPYFARRVGLDLFGIATEDAEQPGVDIRAQGDLPHDRLLGEVARRSVYLHPYRWTSLGLALIEAMFLGLPVVVLATLEAGLVIPHEAGVVSNQVSVLRTGMFELLEDREEARRRGAHARAYAMERFALRRFLDDWQRVFEEVA